MHPKVQQLILPDLRWDVRWFFFDIQKKVSVVAVVAMPKCISARVGQFRFTWQKLIPIAVDYFVNGKGMAIKEMHADCSYTSVLVPISII